MCRSETAIPYHKIGLFQTCDFLSCSFVQKYTRKHHFNLDYTKIFQVLGVLSFVGIVVAFLFFIIELCTHKVKIFCIIFDVIASKFKLKLAAILGALVIVSVLETNDLKITVI